MAKRIPRRGTALEPEEVLTWMQQLLAFAKHYQKWIMAGTLAVVLAAAAVQVNAYLKRSRQAEAAQALAQVRPKLDRPEEAAAATQALADLVKKYPGTPAAREAALYRAHLLYQGGKYEEAGRAYEELAAGLAGEPGLSALVTESLSYCYEAQGKYPDAARVLKPLADQAGGAFQGEVWRRLAYLHEKAGNSEEARRYWGELLKKPPVPAMVPYIKEKLAGLEAPPKK